MNADTTLTYSGLNCPTCGYNLQGLLEPKCPECGCEFNPTDLVIEKYRKPFKPAWLMVSAFFATLVMLASWSHAYTFATHTGRCGTPNATAYMTHIVFLPPLLVPPFFIMLGTRQGRGRKHFAAARLLCIVPTTVWLTVFIIIQWPQLLLRAFHFWL